MASVLVVISLLSLSFTTVAGAGAQFNHSNSISLGSFLSPTTHPNSWPSPSGRFAFGFYRQITGFAVGIWLVGNSGKKVVWTARRDDPPLSSDATLNLTTDGRLLLRARQSEEEKRIANVSEPASYASMLDSGNFVLYNSTFGVIWESFDFPTNTILGGQYLSPGNQLFSSVSDTNDSTGRFHLQMQVDGNLVLYPLNTGDTPGDAYWSTLTFGAKFDLYLNYTGRLCILDKYGQLMWYLPAISSSDDNGAIIYRATLDADGNFRLYSHSFKNKDGLSSSISIVWSALNSQCEIKSFCGFNSYCTFNDIEPNCLCLPGFDFIDTNQKSRGCERNFTEQSCRTGSDNTTPLYNITTLDNIVWGDHPYFEASMSKEDCNKSCLEDCNCGAALFQKQKCQKQKLPLRYVRRDLEQSTTAFLKVGTTVTIESPPNTTLTTPLEPQVVIEKGAMVLIVLICLGFFTCSCAAISFSGFFIYSHRVLKYRRIAEMGNLGLSEEFTLRLFSYDELLKATQGFKQELGRGSFGAVYKGTLDKSKKIVAVKRLEKVVEEGEREFRTEMRAIGRTHHRNLVRLIGYCAEDSKRLLVYEYMSNGSLANLLFKGERRPDWNERVRIALDVARGILYLHEECETPVIHCDIKPQNILMDDFWTAKISDFGLAKLLMPNQTRTFTGVRGTRGYLAPEWQKNTPVSVKADIYSFGIMLLEIVCCRKNIEVNVMESDEVVLSNWVYKCFVERQLGKLVSGEEVDKKTFEMMVKVGLWCIQDEPVLRPSTKNVIRMLEGTMETTIPPPPSSSFVFS